MSLKSDLAEAVAAAERGLRRCTVCEALAAATPSEGESLRKALASSLGSKRLSIILQDNGFAVGVPSVRSHRSEGHK